MSFFYGGNQRIELVRTCEACPEQYSLFIDGEQAAYYRLRHGEFRVDVPECGGVTVYRAEPNGDGCFDESERARFLGEALAAVLAYREAHNVSA